jgi:hypothetical protein
MPFANIVFITAICAIGTKNAIAHIIKSGDMLLSMLAPYITKSIQYLANGIF